MTAAAIPFSVPGRDAGLDIPAHANALAAMGPAWLTRAFRAYGTLAPDNRVTAITALVPFAGGNSGHKARLAVAYATPSPDLPHDLFVKFSRDFHDPFRDRRRHELEAEVRLARLSRHPGFPVAVPPALFADFDDASGTGLLISGAIQFGQDGIEPLHPKCRDDLLPEPAAHYRALMTALGRLAGTHMAGALSPLADQLFPFDAAASRAELPIAWDAAGISAAVARFGRFAAAHPALVAPALAEPGFLARLEAQAHRFLAHEARVREVLHADPVMIALVHWNGHVDNAWFFQATNGDLACGLMDWGMVRQMNLGVALWGCLSGMDHAALVAGHADLLDVFRAAVAQAGGPEIPARTLALHFDLAVMLLMLSMMLDVARLVETRLPAARLANGPHDPIMATDEVARCFLHVALGALTLWQARDLGARLDQLE